MDQPTELGRILDPQVLEAEDGARARLRITIPAAWLDGPCELTLLVPMRLSCARCDGGGCDGCGRSGVLKAPRDEARRTLTARLPAVVAEGVALRISRPFGAEGDITQLFVELRTGELPSPGVRRHLPPLALDFPPPASRFSLPMAIALSVAASLATVAALLAALFGH